VWSALPPSGLGSGGDPRDWIPDLAVGWTFIGCGLVASARRPASRTGLLMAATGFTWFLGNFAQVGVAAVAWVAAQMVYLYRGPLVQLVLTYPSGRPSSRLVRGAVAVGYAVAVITPVWRSAGAAILLAGLLLGVCGREFVRAVGRQRRARRVALQAAAGLSVVLAGTAAARLLLPPGDVSGPSLLLYQVALCVLAGGLLAGLLVAPWQTDVADLVVELGEARSDTLGGELSRALGDPSLEIGYWLADRVVFVDAEGRVLALPAVGSGRSVTIVEREGQPVAVLVHDPAVLEDPGLLEAVTSAARLAASNARLRAEMQARVVELAASRRRILEARDEERRRLERRLQVAVAAYFVCAEALANVAKHAAAAHVTVAVTAGDGRVRVEIVDDGVGGADPARGSGLRGLADRVETLGGTLQVESVPGHGTRLAAEIPLGGQAR
jgi:signal transduction histidine kinase